MNNIKIKLILNIIKYSLGLPFILCLTILFVVVYIEAFIFDCIVYGNSSSTNTLLEIIKDLWRPIQ